MRIFLLPRTHTDAQILGATSLQWLLFSLVHLTFFGLGPTLDISILSSIPVLLYLWKDNLWPCIVLHGINGIFAYILFPFLDSSIG